MHRNILYNVYLYGRDVVSSLVIRDRKYLAALILTTPRAVTHPMTLRLSYSNCYNRDVMDIHNNNRALLLCSNGDAEFFLMTGEQ